MTVKNGLFAKQKRQRSYMRLIPVLYGITERLQGIINTVGMFVAAGFIPMWNRVQLPPIERYYGAILGGILGERG
jgi:hypothetical protein